MTEVCVYTHPEGRPPDKPLVLAYTKYFTRDACVHSVEAPNGTVAKRLAKKDHIRNCLRLPR